ncbi:MAG: Abi family protein [Coxiellaceae bacterium]|nr:Abi family protein [Coxiellaceae bacterium]
MHNKFIFNKPALSLNEQTTFLKSRGLIISKPNLANHFLKTIGYYRLMAYFKPFLLSDSRINNVFLPNTTFSHILQLYIFDRELRLLVVDALKRIEVALRAAISNTMSIKHGAHWYLNGTLFVNHKRHTAFLNEAYNHLKRSKENFIKDYYHTYKHPPHPPSWMIMECLSFGVISQMYNNIKPRTCRKKIGDTFNQYMDAIAPGNHWGDNKLWQL